MDNVDVIDWEDKYSEDFLSLSIEWLEKYVTVEPSDWEILNHPRIVILDKGGNIFFAKCADRIIGTVAMIKNDAGTFELAKLAVTEEFKGQKIGNKLMKRCIQFAKENGAKMIMLYTNHKLIPAINLYKKYGFREVALEHNKYLESDMKMELAL